MSIKGHRDQIERDFWERDFWRETFGKRPWERDLWRETFGETHFRARTHVCWIFSGKYSLVSVKHLM